jgi:hypothetical protein
MSTKECFPWLTHKTDKLGREDSQFCYGTARYRKSGFRHLRDQRELPRLRIFLARLRRMVSTNVNHFLRQVRMPITGVDAFIRADQS